MYPFSFQNPTRIEFGLGKKKRWGNICTNTVQKGLNYLW